MKDLKYLINNNYKRKESNNKNKFAWLATGLISTALLAYLSYKSLENRVPEDLNELIDAKKSYSYRKMEVNAWKGFDKIAETFEKYYNNEKAVKNNLTIHISIIFVGSTRLWLFKK